MLKRSLCLFLSACLPLAATPSAHADVYDGHPRLVVMIVIDQFRADYLERYRSEFKGRGFRLFLDHGAYFPDCYYDYANTKTAPGHATLGTGAYTDGTGINSNEWWDLSRNKKRPVSSVEDDRYTIVGPGSGSTTTATPTSVEAEESNGATGGTQEAPPSQPAGTSATATQANTQPGASPRNLLASTVGDELRLATDGGSRLFGVSLKDRAAILPAGSTANGAFWIDAKTGQFVTSSYYMTTLPQWATEFDSGPAIQQAASDAGVQTLNNFYNQVGSTNAGNQYEIAFSEALIAGEHLGQHATTDMLTLSLSPNDIEGHHFGPDSPEEQAMVLGLDGDLDGFFTWLDQHVPGGLSNVVLALSADHGIAPTPAVADALGLPGAYIDTQKLIKSLNLAINAKFSPGENDVYVLPDQGFPYFSLNRPMFERAGINEEEAENAVKTAMPGAFDALDKTNAPMKQPDVSVLQAAPAQAMDAAPPAREAQPKAAASRVTPAKTGATAKASESALDTTPATPPPPRVPAQPQLFRTYTRLELAAGQVPPTPFGHLIANSYSAEGGWYVMAIPNAFEMEGSQGTTHFTPYSYDRHVPLGFYGAAFVPGTYRGRVEPVDLAATLASVLDVNQPSASVGKVLTQALRPETAYQYPRPVPARAAGRRRAERATDGAKPDAAKPDAAPTDEAKPADTRPEPK